jgi:hypothetical protein
VLIEGLKATKSYIDPMIVSLTLEPTLRLLRHGDGAVRANAWKTLVAINKCDGSLLSETQRKEMNTAFIGEASLDVVESAFPIITIDLSNEMTMEYLRELLGEMIKGRLFPFHPVLFRRLLKVQVLWNDPIIESLLNQFQPTLAWCSILIDLQNNGLLPRKLDLISELMKTEDVNILYGGLRLLLMKTAALGEDIMIVQRELGHLVGHEDVQIRLTVLKIFFAIANTENWDKISNLALNLVKYPCSSHDHAANICIIELALATVAEYGGEATLDWTCRILSMVPERATKDDIKRLSVPKLDYPVEIRSSRAGILLGLEPIQDHPDYNLRKKLIEAESLSDDEESDDIYVEFDQDIFGSTPHSLARSSSPKISPVSPNYPPELIMDIFASIQKPPGDNH